MLFGLEVNGIFDFYPGSISHVRVNYGFIKFCGWIKKSGTEFVIIQKWNMKVWKENDRKVCLLEISGQWWVGTNVLVSFADFKELGEWEIVIGF